MTIRLLLASLLLSVGCVTADGAAGDDDPMLGGKADGLSTNGCTRGQMFIMGTPRNFGVAPGGPVQMSCVGGVWQVDELFAGTGLVFGAGAFKFHDTGNWSSGTNWGDSQPFDGKAEAFGDGNDITIAQQGWYRIRFNDRTLEYEIVRLPSSCASRTMYVRGTFNGWGTQPMFCVGDNQWAAIPMLIGRDQEFKFDTGTWATNWGDTNKDGTAERNGANIHFYDPGRYLVTFDEATGRYGARLVSASCAWPRMFVRASWNAWQPIEMECENGHYALSIDSGPTQGQFKIDANADWSVNWGDNNGDGWAERDGANIRITGKHHFHFYNEQRYAFDRHD